MTFILSECYNGRMTTTVLYATENRNVLAIIFSISVQLCNVTVSDVDVTGRDIVFTYLNAVQIIYDSDRLSNRLRLVVVRLEIMKTQPADLSTSDGNIEAYLENFCRSVWGEDGDIFQQGMNIFVRND